MEAKECLDYRVIANKTIGFIHEYAAKELALRNTGFLEPARVKSMPFVLFECVN